MRLHLAANVVAVTCLFALTSANAQNVVFTESFSSDTSGWATTNVQVPTYQPTGGADGDGYIESESLTFDGDFSSAFGGPATAVLFRARDEFDSSDGAFFGNWIDENFVGLSFSIRHNATRPLQFFGRFASPNNQFGASVANGQSVPPGQWVDVVLDASRGSSEIVSFGAAGGQPDPYAAIFGDIGRLQISGFQPFGLSPPELQADLLFELDNVQLLAVPEPATIGLVVCGALLIATRLGVRRIR